MPKLIMLCGLPGSGKSMYAEKLKGEGYIIHSSDKIREELGDVNDQSRNIDVFTILYRRIKSDLNNGKSVCFDATNLKRKRRIAFLRELKKITCEKECILVATPFEECLKQNNNRERKVPDEVIWRMFKSFQMPCIQEGFDKVTVHYPKEEWRTCYGDIFEIVDSLVDFNQENSHHALSLGDHMFVAMDNALHTNGRVYDDVVLAAFSHDIGKTVTKDFRNRKGEIDDKAHYYSHHNCGSYLSLFLEYPEYGDKEHISLLIENHMKPYMEWKQSVKTKEKDRVLFGDQFIKDIEFIHEADSNAK